MSSPPPFASFWISPVRLGRPSRDLGREDTAYCAPPSGAAACLARGDRGAARGSPRPRPDRAVGACLPQCAAVVGKDEILKSLEVVIDPELHRSIVELDMVRSIEPSPNGVVDVTVSLTTPGCPIKGHFQTAVAQAVSALDGVTHVNVFFDVLDDSQKAALQQKLGRGSLPQGALAQVANVLC